MIGALVTRDDAFERRARVMPWGIEVQVWRLIDTITIPGTAATLPLNALFPDPDNGGAIPSSPNGDDKTLENLIDGPTAEDCVEEHVDGEDGEVSSNGRTPPGGGREGRGSHGR